MIKLLAFFKQIIVEITEEKDITKGITEIIYKLLSTFIYPKKLSLVKLVIAVILRKLIK